MNTILTASVSSESRHRTRVAKGAGDSITLLLLLPTLLLAALLLFVMTLPASAAVLHVNMASTTHVPSYTNWAGAARTIQDAIDAAVAGDEIWVTNGVYRSGGRTANGTLNRVANTRPWTVESINGAASTTIQGDGVRCVYLTNGAALTGFTLPNGFARAGGGAAGGTLNNCAISGDMAFATSNVSGMNRQCLLKMKSVVAFLSQQVDYLKCVEEKKDDKGKVIPKTAPELQALTNFCQSLLSANEFLYVD